uniref:diacylglycerol O-acyltransferase 2 n=1 Tax=Myxine glutinosa TaxID=7769 RepID=UPI00358E8725
MKTLIAAYSAGGLQVSGAAGLREAICSRLPRVGLTFQQNCVALTALAVLQWEITFLIMGLGCCILILYLLTTPLWPISALYLTWLTTDWRTPEKGGRRSAWVRGWSVWKYFRNYFPIELIKTCDLPSNRNYVFGYHPHGIMSVGAFCNFCTEATDFSKTFPGIKPSLATLAGQFRLPIFRDYLMAGGLCPVSRGAIDHLLSQSGCGRAVVIVIGGAAESLKCRPGSTHLMLLKRRGFVRLALRHGADLVPVFSFGENDIFHQVALPEGSWAQCLQTRFQKLVGFAPCIFHGRSVLGKYVCGILPFSLPIHTIVGEPVTVPKIDEPTDEDVQRFHTLYVESLVKVFNSNKLKYGLREADCLVID